MARAKKETALTPEERLQAALVPDWEWPYKLPENWCWTNWGECGEFVAGSGFKNEYQGFTNYDIPFYKVSSLKTANETGYLCDNTNTVDETVRKKIKAALIPANSLLFAKIGEAIRLNRRAINTVPCCVDNNMMAFIPIICQLKYAFYWSKGIDLYDFTNATTVPAIRKTDLEKISFPLAPLAEQQRIVDRIESLFAKLDEAKEKAQAVVDSFETRKAAILHKAFTGELTAKWREEHGVGMESWKKKRLSDVVTEFKYGTSEKSDYNNKGIPVLRIPNIGDNGIDLSDIKYLNHRNVDSESQIHEGDILIIRSNGSRDLVGKAVLVPELGCEYAYASFLIRAKPNHSIINAHYLTIFLNSTDARGQMFRRAKSSAGINNINTKELGAISLTVPSLPEQDEIVHIINEMMDKDQQSKEAAEVALDQIDLMKKSILARAFRGELGTNDTSEESAVELLKEIIRRG